MAKSKKLGLQAILCAVALCFSVCFAVSLSTRSVRAEEGKQMLSKAAMTISSATLADNGWGTWPDGSAVVDTTTNYGNDGTYSLKLSSETRTNMNVATYVENMVVGKSYKFSVAIKTEGVWNHSGGTGAYLDFGQRPGITKDDYKGYILSGKYDYGVGDWNNSYIVTSLFEESMLLSVEGGDVCKYVRCYEVPTEIVDWFESEN